MNETLVTSKDAVTTYRYVRLGLVALVVFLTVSVVCTYKQAGGWQNSISAYFYTSSHSVFIASLCAIGVCLIVYQGSTTTEDALLNFSGVLAIIVGLVPTGREPLRGPGLPEDFDVRAFVGNNVFALIVASVGAVALYWIIRIIRNRLDTPPHPKLRPQQHKPPSQSNEKLPAILAVVINFLRRVLPKLAPALRYLGRALPLILLLALVGGALVFFADFNLRTFKLEDGPFINSAHTWAAYTMFGGIIVVALHYACYAAVRDDRGPRMRLAFVGGYLIIAGLMVLTVAVIAVLQCSGNGIGLLRVEFIVIGEFAVFWLLQSVDLWELETYQVPSLSDLLEKLGAPEPKPAT